MSSVDDESVLGVILAGGRAQRMGGVDKALITLGEQVLLEHAVEFARHQVDRVLISSNRKDALSSWLPFDDLVVISDESRHQHGPLAGIISAMVWSGNNRSRHEWLASFAVDTPFAPANFVARCREAAERTGADVVYAQSGNRGHYTMALWRMNLLPRLQRQLADGEQALRHVMAGTGAAAVDFHLQSGCIDPFFNINTPEDLHIASEWVASQAPK